MFTYFSGFAGIGGFDEGIRRVLPTAECVGFSENDKHAIQIYEKHFPNRINYGDITKIRAKDFPDCDIFCGGFPCPDFSKAGKHAGFRGKRGRLFFDIIRIIRKRKPRVVFLENVEGLLSSHKGWDFAQVLVALAKLRYFCEWQVLNSADFGVPQTRKRVFIIGHLGGFTRSKVFPLREDDQVPCGETVEEGVQQNACCLSGRHYANWNGNYVANCLTGGGKSGGLHSSMTLLQVGYIGKDADATRVYSPAGMSRSLKGGGGLGSNTGLYCVSDSGLHRTSQIRTETISPLRANTGCSSNNIINGIRRLTPLECERVQGFPDRWTGGVADGHRYRLLGNAVTVPVISAIMEKIVKIYEWG